MLLRRSLLHHLLLLMLEGLLLHDLVLMLLRRSLLHYLLPLMLDGLLLHDMLLSRSLLKPLLYR